MLNKYYSQATISVKVILTILFAILWIGETMDKNVDIGDLVAPFLLLLMINDIYMHVKKTDYQTSFKYFVQGNVGQEKQNPFRHLMKPAFSFFFSMLLILPVLFDFHGVSEYYMNLIFKTLALGWSLTYLAINIKRLRKNIAIPQIIVTNVALGLFVGTIILI
ncbi:MAG: hypothetical protein GY909_13580 [Oligoflexia bacterium]|nr:hypothetical protein [Oligoflexia bacterium]